MPFTVNLTRRVRKRQLSCGNTVRQTRHVLNYVDPHTHRRRQEFFDRRDDARARRNELLVSVETGAYSNPRTAPTIAEAIDHWLETKASRVKANTIASCRIVAAHIRGGRLQAVPILGPMKVADLTTATIRRWHAALADEVGTYTANRAIGYLRSALALAEEDFGVRAPAMPTQLRRGGPKSKKAILATDQVARLLREAQGDAERGVYYAFPFLAGTRPSEQLGLLWDDVDFDAGVIRISRIQERDGSLTDMTKTEAGTRDIPMGPKLRRMLLEWRVVCPRRLGELHRVFPGPGRLAPWPQPRMGGGGALLYQNFRKRMWAPVFERLGLPYVTPHAARHAFVSTLQAQGIEVGLVAKLAGHANPVVTLGHYTQAVRGGEDAVAALERAYGAP